MNHVSRSLTFLPTPWSLGLSAVADRGDGRPRPRRLAAERLSSASVGVLELIRLACVLLARGAPESARVDRGVPARGESRRSLVLWDASPSMETRDVSRGEKTSASARDPPRGDRAADPSRSLERARREAAGRHPAVLAQRGRAAAPTSTTRSRKAPETIPNLRGVVLASDGDWNEGQPPVLAALEAADEGRAGLRRAGRQPDPGCPTSSCSASTRRPSAWPASRSASRSRSTAPCLAAYATTVTLKTSDGDEVTKEVRIEPMARTVDEVIWKPKGTGDFTLTLSIPKHADEALADNNTPVGADRDPRGEAAASWSSNRTRAGSIATSGTPSRATRGSTSRACCSTPA